MSWTSEQLHARLSNAKRAPVNIKSIDQATEKAGLSAKIIPEEGEINFLVIGDPMGKPRMTQRDRWKKRPVVLRYHDYCDRIREAAPTLVAQVDVYAVDVIAHIAMPDSWAKKKKAALDEQMCRGKPDWDNIGKAVCDALFEEDSGIADGRTRKFWCLEGEQCTEVRVWFYRKTVLSG
jgi:Holliday junction resolvase RusA-like endonuclease